MIERQLALAHVFSLLAVSCAARSIVPSPSPNNASDPPDEPTPTLVKKPERDPPLVAAPAIGSQAEPVAVGGQSVANYPELSRYFLGIVLKAAGSIGVSETPENRFRKSNLGELNSVISLTGFKVRDVNYPELLNCSNLRRAPLVHDDLDVCWDQLLNVLYAFRSAWDVRNVAEDVEVEAAENGFYVRIQPSIYVMHVLGFSENARLVGIQYLVKQDHQ